MFFVAESMQYFYFSTLLSRNKNVLFRLDGAIKRRPGLWNEVKIVFKIAGEVHEELENLVI